VRGGAAISMRWKSGKVESLELHTTARVALRIIPPEGQTITRATTAGGETISPGPNGTMALESDTSYRVTFQ
jgi:hypothetical protein